VNTLEDAGCKKPIVSRLEGLLTSFTGERSSRGIIQGVVPSDLFGNFYLTPIDQFLDDQGVLSARYVDDIYIFIASVADADQLMQNLIPRLRAYDVSLNEAKSVIIPKSSLITEEPDLEELFQSAIEEISLESDSGEHQTDYGFQSDWEDLDEEQEAEAEAGDEDDGDLELKATKLLYDAMSEYPGHEENIERFCLPLFSRAESSYAVEGVMKAFGQRPAMSQMYSSYLAKFVTDVDVQAFLKERLEDEKLTDWSRMWALAALSQAKPVDDEPVKAASKVVENASKHIALRAAAAIYVGRYGDHARRKALAAVYANVQPYMQAAIYFSSRYWPDVERKNARASWGSLTEINVLLTRAMWPEKKQPAAAPKKP
jgi:hypothetical protein